MKTKDGAPDSSTHIFGPERTRSATLPFALSLSQQPSAVSSVQFPEIARHKVSISFRCISNKTNDRHPLSPTHFSKVLDGPPGTSHSPLATAFLIDTKTIRNRPKPLTMCSLRFSNRHDLASTASASGANSGENGRHFGACKGKEAFNNCGIELSAACFDQAALGILEGQALAIRTR
jgi:hypothetical protein